jgi:hypothetical protein
VFWGRTSVTTGAGLSAAMLAVGSSATRADAVGAAAPAKAAAMSAVRVNLMGELLLVWPPAAAVTRRLGGGRIAAVTLA